MIISLWALPDGIIGKQLASAATRQSTITGPSCAIIASLWTLAYVGFDGKGGNAPDTILSMMLIYIVPPTLISIAIAAVMWRFPLDEAKQRELRRILEERSAAGTAIGHRIGHAIEDEPELPAAAEAVAAKPAE